MRCQSSLWFSYITNYICSTLINNCRLSLHSRNQNISILFLRTANVKTILHSDHKNLYLIIHIHMLTKFVHNMLANTFLKNILIPSCIAYFEQNMVMNIPYRIVVFLSANQNKFKNICMQLQGLNRTQPFHLYPWSFYHGINPNAMVLPWRSSFETLTFVADN